MPEGRPFPYKYFPRRGVALSVTFGEPVPERDVKAALAARISERTDEDKLPLTEQRTRDERNSRSRTSTGWLRDTTTGKGGSIAPDAHETACVRSAVAALLHRDVEALGRKVMRLASVR